MRRLSSKKAGVSHDSVIIIITKKKGKVYIACLSMKRLEIESNCLGISACEMHMRSRYGFIGASGRHILDEEVPWLFATCQVDIGRKGPSKSNVHHFIT